MLRERVFLELRHFFSLGVGVGGGRNRCRQRRRRRRLRRRLFELAFGLFLLFLIHWRLLRGMQRVFEDPGKERGHGLLLAPEAGTVEFFLWEKKIDDLTHFCLFRCTPFLSCCGRGLTQFPAGIRVFSRGLS